ncbi:hypothetical protein ES044_16265 [Polaribacter sp. IC066]|uniref:hypothetical protein n=1 Tax=Polaribacter sp. IC066 TaxID=57032 RepID=UPI0011BEA8E4|nr:hypothetical protein [Polaribacter sp. IC066]TXD56783.1 hypothetical protein ES044_16265 [Polaribacter sp. IC066]
MRTLLILVTFLFVFSSFSAQRTLYVDSFNAILGNQEKENELLTFVKNNEFKAIILYELHIIAKRIDMSNPKTNTILAKFINLAKKQYEVQEVIASAENKSFFINHISAYNKSRLKSSEKFDGLNLEYEFWQNSASNYGGYYCENYLRKNEIPCTREGSFKNFIATLSIMKLLSKESDHPIKIEAYVGNYNKTEVDEISKYVDRILVSAYEKNTEESFKSIKKALTILSQTTFKPNVSVIFSSEVEFMSGYFKYNSLEKSELEFLSLSKNYNFKLGKFIYYKYFELKNSVKYYNFTSK